MVGTAVFGAPRFCIFLWKNAVFSRVLAKNRGAPKMAVPTTTHPIPHLTPSENFSLLRTQTKTKEDQDRSTIQASLVGPLVDPLVGSNSAVLVPTCSVRRRTNVQQLTCKIDLSCSLHYLFFSFVLIELKPFVLKGKVPGEKL